MGSLTIHLDYTFTKGEYIYLSMRRPSLHTSQVTMDDGRYIDKGN